LKSKIKITLLIVFIFCFNALLSKQAAFMTEFEQNFNDFKHYEDRHNAILNLVYNYPELDSSFVLLYLKETLQIATINNNRDKLFELYLSLSDFYLSHLNYNAVYDYSKIALHYQDSTKKKELIFNNYRNLAISSFKKNYFDESIQWYNSAFKMAEIIKDNTKKAEVLSKLSVIYNHQGETNKAIEYAKQSLEIRQKLNNIDELILNYSNLGSYYIRISDYSNSLEYFLKALSYAESISDSLAIGTANMNIGTVYHYLRNNDKALEFYLESLKYINEKDNPLILSKIYNNLALNYKKRNIINKAIEYHKKSLDINLKYNHTNNVATSYVNLGSIYSDIGEYDTAIKYFTNALPIYESLGNDFGLCSVYNNLGAVYMRNNQLKKALDYAIIANKIAKQIGAKSNIITNYAVIIKIYELMNDYENAYNNFLIYSNYRDSVYNENNQRQINEMQVRYETEKKEKENELLKKDQVIQALNYTKLRFQWISLFIIVIILTIFIIIIIILYSKQKLTYNELFDANRIIEIEKTKSDELLLNILPFQVAEDIKKTGHSQPQAFDEVTVFYSDLVNFTEICSNLSPIEVITELNEIFSEFDKIFKHNQCEKIKTIGDAYIAICGITQNDEKHANKIMQSAIEILTFLHQRHQTKAIKWKIRIGIHTGKIVGGVVGKNKFIYDIFGDTINISSRLEHICKPMKINLSESTYKLIQDSFTLDTHESINIKGKGLMKIYHYDLSNEMSEV